MSKKLGFRLDSSLKNMIISRRKNRPRSHRKNPISSTSTSSTSPSSSSTSLSTFLSLSTSSSIPTIGMNDVSSVVSPLDCHSPLIRTKSEHSIDSSSCMSLSALNPTATQFNMASTVTMTSSKKKEKKNEKQRGWKIWKWKKTSGRKIGKRKKKGGRKIGKRKNRSGWNTGQRKKRSGWKIVTRKKDKGWRIGKCNKVDNCRMQKERMSTSPTTAMEDDMLPPLQQVRWKLREEGHQQHEVDEAQSCGMQERQSYKLVIKPSDSTDTTDTTSTTSTISTISTTSTAYRRKRDYPHHRYHRQHEIQMNHRAILSQEPITKLANKVGFNKDIKSNRNNLAGDFLLEKILRERTRIQRKLDMLDSNLEMYVNLHGGSTQPSSAAASGASSRSEASEVGGGGCERRSLLSGSSENVTTSGDRNAVFAI